VSLSLSLSLSLFLYPEKECVPLSLYLYTNCSIDYRFDSERSASHSTGLASRRIRLIITNWFMDFTLLFTLSPLKASLLLHCCHDHVIVALTIGDKFKEPPRRRILSYYILYIVTTHRTPLRKGRESCGREVGESSVRYTCVRIDRRLIEDRVLSLTELHRRLVSHSAAYALPRLRGFAC